ncbi:MAG: hypothetical protein A2908_02875 [Candidatus Staskawiczbacteria bacterium RIFCSPLOWO2_01_FULL_38_12b]|uniref:Phosphatidic acid phosphatase type 2/haloperoxidase domain-containing protein n=1 Tax=Candidatus Staskawiczbacteria bacterium RIFCSPLOWO2_01_FULL_38_12b TaxID=1802214 RepID=A0A1G2IGL9_9BACT|nr:MAG: hypothetical protein A2908_02875 [Candidatus Staskawiczbacteria bacterium RIFCSPLOWO2_01_FULL_38_12b]
MYYDLVVFNAINSFAGTSILLDGLAIFLADYLPFVLGFWLISFLWYPKGDRIKNRLMVIVALFSGLVARFAIKPWVVFFYNRPRPYVTLPFVHKLIPTFFFSDVQSFPSGHALFFFAVSVAIYGFNKKLGIVFFLASGVMAMARIFVGVHWPSDILTGAFLGAITGLIMRWFYIKYQPVADRIIATIF